MTALHLHEVQSQAEPICGRSQDSALPRGSTAQQRYQWNFWGLARCYFPNQVLHMGTLIVCNTSGCTFKIILFLRYVRRQRNTCLKNILVANTHTGNKLSLTPGCNLKIHFHPLRNAASRQRNDNSIHNRPTEGPYLQDDHFPKAELVTFSYTFRGPQGFLGAQVLSLCIDMIISQPASTRLTSLST